MCKEKYYSEPEKSDLIERESNDAALNLPDNPKAEKPSKKQESDNRSKKDSLNTENSLHFKATKVSIFSWFAFHSFI